MKTQYRQVQPKTRTKNDEPQSVQAQAVDAGGVVIGKLVGLTDLNEPLVAFDLESTQSPLIALSVVPISEENIGSEVVLSFVRNRDGAPVLMGVVQSRFEPSALSSQHVIAQTGERQEESPPELLVNGEKINITAAKEITLKCGKSSITLNQSGKILIKGEHILSRASGANRVRGGSIQLN